MSPSPTSRAGGGVAIGLCHDAIGMVRLGGWRHARVDGHELVAVEEPDTDGLAALAALDHWLQQNRPAASGLRRWLSAPAHVVLSDQLLRYARIPWSGATLSRQEEEALTLACFEERYGDMSGWTVRGEGGRYGQGRLVGAVPTALADGLQRVLHTHKLNCQTVTPYFIACWNRWRCDIAKATGKADALFAVADAGTAVIGVIDGGGGGWRSLRRLRVATHAAELLPVLAREAVMLGLTDELATWVHSPQPGVFATAQGKLNVLSSATGLPTPILMALAGAGA